MGTAGIGPTTPGHCGGAPDPNDQNVFETGHLRAMIAASNRLEKHLAVREQSRGGEPRSAVMNASSEETVSFVPEERVRARVHNRFEELRSKLQAMVPGAQIEHVGSTAIAGSLTKGDLDVQVRVVASEYRAAKERLCKLYDVNVGGFSGSDAVSFEDYSGQPHVGIHLTVVGGSSDIQWRFRDLLLASEFLRQEYDDLKCRFEGKSMAKYRDAKADFVERVLSGAVNA